MLTNPLTMVSLLRNSHSLRGLYKSWNHPTMRICQRWNWWSGASTSSERRQSQVRGLSQGVLSRHSSPGSTTGLCQSNPFVFTFVKGYPQNSTICSKFFLRTWRDTSMCTSVVWYMHSGIYAMLRKQLEVEIEHLVGSDTLCRGWIWKVNHPTFWSYFC